MTKDQLNISEASSRTPGYPIFLVLVLLSSVLLSGCVTSPPSQTENICKIFKEKDDWYDDASKARKRWGSSIPVMMAIMHQESRFRPKAKPPRTKILGFIPGPRKSSAYGFAQAKKETWAWYIKSSDNRGADRDDFTDAIDFIGWYNSLSHRQSKIDLTDPYHLYLAYHEGHGGFNRRSFKNKSWLKQVAKKVSARSVSYQKQLNGCEESLQSNSWWWPF